MPTKSMHYVELAAVSLERATAFYRAVFDWEFAAPPAEHQVRDVVYLDAVPEVGLRLGATPDAASGVRPAVAVDSIAATLERVTASGGEVIDAREDVGDGYTAAFSDSEGNRIGLWEFK